MPPFNIFDILNIAELAKKFAPKNQETFTQQTAGTLSAFTVADEAIFAQLLAVADEINPGTRKRIGELQALLETHQGDRWRAVIAKMDQTERHETFVTERRVNLTGGTGEDLELAEQEGVLSFRRRGRQTNPQPGAPQKGQPKDSRAEANLKQERLRRDYEFTAEDTRVKHILQVAKIIEEDGAAAAKAWLIANNFAREKSLAQEAGDRVKQAKEKTERVISATWAALLLGKEYERIMARDIPDEDKKNLINKALKKKKERKTAEGKLKSQVPGAAIVFALSTIVLVAAMAFAAAQG